MLVGFHHFFLCGYSATYGILIISIRHLHLVSRKVQKV
jgi:hypothetical protein